MMRASEEQLRGRTILKAARATKEVPPRPTKASREVMSTRKIYKAKRFTGGSEPTSSPAPPAPNLHAKAPNSKSGMHSSRPSPTATKPTNDAKPSSATQTTNSNASPPMNGTAQKAAGPTNVDQTFDLPPATMMRASEEKLRGRTILKANRLSPPPRATKEVLSQRKLYKAKRDTVIGEPTTSPATSTPNHRTNDPNSKTEQMPSSEPAPAATAPANDGEGSVETVLRVRAKLCSKVGKSWTRRAAGTLTCYRNANNQVFLKLLNEKAAGPACVNAIDQPFDLGVAMLQNVKRVIKESEKGKATFVRFDYDQGDGPFLLQVKPEHLEQLFSVMAL